MAYILVKILSLFILNLVINKASNSSCITNVFDLFNITEIKITNRNFKYLNQILKKNQNKTIDLILSWLDLDNVENIIINNLYLNKLDLSFNNIKLIPEYVFSRIKFIKELDFRGCIENSDLTGFYRDIDNNLCAFLYLEKLDFSYNNLTSLDKNNFEKLENLKFIKLDYNQLKIVSTVNLYKFNRVKELIFGNEEMIIEDGFLFKNFTRLELLDLKYCKFKSLNSNLFGGLKNLTSLFFTGINLDNLPKNIFYELNNLRNLSLKKVASN